MRALANRRGVVLPAALLVLLAVGAIAGAITALARSEILAERSSLRYVRQAALVRASLRGEEGAPDPARDPLIAGYSVGGVAAIPGGLVHYAVQWAMDPDRVAATLPGAVEAATPPSSGVETSESCAASLARAATRTSPLVDGGGTPRVGALGPADLAGLAGTRVESGVLPQNPEIAVLSAPPSSRIIAGDGQGLLVSTGSLTLEGTARFTGLVVAGGDVRVDDAALVEGVILAAGTVSVTPGGRIVGCVERALEALRHDTLAGPHTLSGGFLGRY